MIGLKKLEQKLDAALARETTKSLRKFFRKHKPRTKRQRFNNYLKQQRNEKL